MKKLIPAFLFGFIFALGLGIAGMTQPQKIIGFLDIFGDWDPSLAWVMAGAILVHSITYRSILKKPTPILAQVFSIPKKNDLDVKLIGGAVLFGIGWGIAGFCPAPAITSLASFNSQTMLFVGAMLSGMFFFKLTDLKKRKGT